jgi:hypothetical protein
MSIIRCEDPVYREASQLGDAELDLVTGANSIWKSPGGGRSPKPHCGGPGAGDTIDPIPWGGGAESWGVVNNNLPGGGPGSGPWGN